ncbi:MAG: flagellar motor switch protein FliG [Acidimicrobiia bacterium]|nr:flagellar motor switch protein FliG [Acidimicrobiia bacterium]
MTQTMSSDGVRRAAILMLRLGVEQAGPLLRKLRSEEVAAIVAEMARLGPVNTEMANSIYDDFTKVASSGTKPLRVGDAELAREMLEANFGDRAAREVLSTIDEIATSVPFQYLDALDPSVVADHLQAEHPQVTAAVLSHLGADEAAKVLNALPEELLADVGVRLGRMEKVASAAVDALESGLRTKMTPVLERRFREAGGGPILVALLNRMDNASADAIFGALETSDPELAKEVRALLFVFEDLTLLDDRQMQRLLREVDMSVLPLALKGAPSWLRDHVLDNLSSRAKDNLLDEMEIIGSVRMTDVEEAREQILEEVRKLESSGELVINRGGGDYVT